jgi:hypothetical protein
VANVGWVFWLIPISLVGVAATAAYYGEHSAARDLILWAAGLTAFGLGVRHAWRRIKARGTTEDQFFAWLGTHRSLVEEGTAMFRGVRVTPATELVRFTTVISIGVATFRTPSRFYVCGVEPTGWVNLAYTTATLVLGWWGIPWGPVYTPVAIFRNLSGGERVTVGDVLANVELGDDEKPDPLTGVRRAG